MAGCCPQVARERRSGAGRRPERGSVLAEFALVLPLLLILLFGVLELGIAFNRAQAVEAAAREGGRLASISSSNGADVVARVNEALDGIPLDAAPTVTVAPGGCAGREGQSVTVTVAYVHNVTIPLLFSRDVPLTSQAVFRCEA